MIPEADFKESINEYLEGLEIAKVKSLEELVQFNEDHAETELPEGIVNPATPESLRQR